MIPKSGHRFSEKIMRKQNAGANSDSIRMHQALVRTIRERRCQPKRDLSASPARRELSDRSVATLRHQRGRSNKAKFSENRVVPARAGVASSGGKWPDNPAPALYNNQNATRRTAP
jgi:hypothetical protein